MRYAYLGLGICLVAGVILVTFLSFMWLWVAALIAVLAVMASFLVRGRR